MALPRLIFVDGIPGSGKSTTAQQLCFHLESLGLPARWYYEHEVGHPIFDDEQVRLARELGAAEPNRIFEQALVGWSVLVARLQTSNEIVIIESTLFQTTVGTQLLMDLDPGQIEQHFQRVADIIAPLAPALIHLRQADIGGALRRICAKRHPWFEEFVLAELARSARGQRRAGRDFAEIEAFFLEHRALADRLFDRFPGRRVTHDNTDGDWARQRDAVTQLLEIPSMQLPLPPSNPADFTGEFRAENTGDTWTIVADEVGLRFADDGGTRLVPHGRDRFAMEGVCAEIIFERDAAGRVTRARCIGALPQLAPLWLKV